ncbi:MAG TPA: hypothetical protein VJR25_01030 [Microbacterium sp.]|uniref:hypothetical protein n=1 Tax=Microbacterium sp. TaxID=51671 RepID=UPI002B46CC34|nr:hypothetical protein [Microbacterium sp.]HKT55328.1 hypothetical protein [Microbacterium sp.]
MGVGPERSALRARLVDLLLRTVLLVAVVVFAILSQHMAPQQKVPLLIGLAVAAVGGLVLSVVRLRRRPAVRRANTASIASRSAEDARRVRRAVRIRVFGYTGTLGVNAAICFVVAVFVGSPYREALLLTGGVLIASTAVILLAGVRSGHLWARRR